jgi:hypothetical protein
MIPTEYVAKLEEIKADIEGITQPQMPQLPSAANEKPQSQPQQQPGQRLSLMPELLLRLVKFRWKLS